MDGRRHDRGDPVVTQNPAYRSTRPPPRWLTCVERTSCLLRGMFHEATRCRMVSYIRVCFGCSCCLGVALEARPAGTLLGRVYCLDAVEATFGADVNYAMLHKIYGAATGAGDERRYSPTVCTGIDKRVITGNPDDTKVSTSYVERQNLTMRMGMRRFTRLTNAFCRVPGARRVRPGILRPRVDPH